MVATTRIEWAERVWNVMLGCTMCSPGCKNCYAICETGRERCEAHVGLAVLQPTPNWTGKIRFLPERLDEPLRRTIPATWFVNSLSDFLHENARLDWQVAALEVMKLAEWHVFQVLTKRHRRLQSLLGAELCDYAALPNVLWGVSVEDRKYGLPRVDALRESAAGFKWLSIEPLLEDLGEVDLQGIDWVVVGGESGRRARPMKEDWVLSIQEQCKAADVPFFFKQWGNWRPYRRGLTGSRIHTWPDRTRSIYMAKARSGRRLRGRQYNTSPTIHSSLCPNASIRRRLRKQIEAISGQIGVCEVQAR